MLVAIVADSCVVSDRSKGVFELHASGGLQVDYRGPAQALTQWSTYGIELDLKKPGSPLRGESGLSFWFKSKPDTGVWQSTSSQVPDAHRFTVNLGGATDGVMRWQADSGRIRITSPARVAGVSGSFTVYAHCDKCGPTDLPSQGVLSGTFATRE